MINSSINFLITVSYESIIVNATAHPVRYEVIADAFYKGSMIGVYYRYLLEPNRRVHIAGELKKFDWVADSHDYDSATGSIRLDREGRLVTRDMKSGKIVPDPKCPR